MLSTISSNRSSRNASIKTSDSLERDECTLEDISCSPTDFAINGKLTASVTGCMHTIPANDAAHAMMEDTTFPNTLDAQAQALVLQLSIPADIVTEANSDIVDDAGNGSVTNSKTDVAERDISDMANTADTSTPDTTIVALTHRLSRVSLDLKQQLKKWTLSELMSLGEPLDDVPFISYPVVIRSESKIDLAQELINSIKALPISRTYAQANNSDLYISQQQRSRSRSTFYLGSHHPLQHSPLDDAARVVRTKYNYGPMLHESFFHKACVVGG